MAKEIRIQFDGSEVKGALEKLAPQYVKGRIVRASIAFLDEAGDPVEVQGIELSVEVEADE